MGCGFSKHRHVVYMENIKKENQVEFALLGLHEYHVGKIHQKFNELDSDG